MAGNWAGRKVRDARAYWAKRLPVPCAKCGKPVLHEAGKRAGGWNVGHQIDRWMGGPDDLSNTWPEHAHCNMSAGGKVGAAMTNRNIKPATVTMLPESTRRIRGR